MNFNFEPYPFEKLRTLLSNVKPSEKYENIALTIGEPQFDTPSLITEALCQNAKLLNKYPKTAGEERLNDALQGFVQRNFGLTLKTSQLISTLGTREALFNFPQYLLFNTDAPIMAYPNPFYQIYEGAAKAAKADVVHLDLMAINDFKPQIGEVKALIGRGVKPHLIILNSPNNPTGSEMSLDELKEWAQLAAQEDIVVLNDECYNQIYFDKRPASLLEAAAAIGNTEFKNTLIVNSLSKRSSAPGLRSGFIAGDEKILEGYLLYRTYLGATNGLPMQLAAAAAWEDEAHVEAARQKYRQNYHLAEEILGVSSVNSTFYLYLNVKDGERFAKELMESKNVSVLPAAYLSRGAIANEYVRIALVQDEQKTKEALMRIKEFLQEGAA